MSLRNVKAWNVFWGLLVSSLASAATLTAAPAKVEFLKYGELHQTTTERVAEYQVSTCLQLNQHPAANTAISISSTHQTITTNAKGCLTWMESLTHKVYAAEKDFVQNIILKSNSANAQISLTLLFNPFRPGSSSGVDARLASQERKLTPARAAPYLLLTSMSVQYNGSGYQVDNLLNISLKRRYFISASPSVVRYDSQSPTLSRTDNLRDGNYYFRATLFRGDKALVNSFDMFANHDAAKAIIDSSDQIVKVSGGQLTAFVEFQTQDLLAIGTRNTLAVEIYPLDDNKLQQFTTTTAVSSLIDYQAGLEPQVYFSSFVPVNENSVALFPSGSHQDISLGEFSAKKLAVDSMTQFISSAQAERLFTNINTSGTSQIETSAHDNGLALFLPESQLYKQFSLNPQPFLQLAHSGLLNGAVKNGVSSELQSNLSRLCRNSFMDALGLGAIIVRGTHQMAPTVEMQKAFSIAETCRKNPLRFFNLSHVVDVIEVDSSQTQWLGGRSQSFNISSNFDLTMGHNLSSSLQETTSLGVGASIRPFALFNSTLSKIPVLGEIFSASIDWGLNWSSSRSDTVQQGNGHSVSFSRGLSLVEQQADLKVKVNRFRPCLSVTVKEEFLGALSTDGNISAWAPRGYQFCAEEESRPISLIENYFFFSQQFAIGDYVDTRDPKNRPFVLSLRGMRDYFVFLGVTNRLLDAPQVDNESKSNPQDIFLRGMKLFADEHRSVPGQHNSFNTLDQINFAVDTTESSQAKQFYNDLRQTLSPWVRKDLTPLAK